MNPNNALSCLESKWRDYLEEHGHYIYKTRNSFRVTRSRNSNKIRYRWLLLVGHGLKRTLSKPELSNVRQNLKKARMQKEVTYLVVGFTQEPRRVVILPAGSALKTGYVRSDKGGIAWDD
jgi:hypothetical protein